MEGPPISTIHLVKEDEQQPATASWQRQMMESNLTCVVAALKALSPERSAEVAEWERTGWNLLKGIVNSNASQHRPGTALRRPETVHRPRTGGPRMSVITVDGVDYSTKHSSIDITHGKMSSIDELLIEQQAQTEVMPNREEIPQFEIDGWNQLFSIMDANSDGSVDILELQKHFSHFSGSERKVAQVFRSFGMGTDGKAQLDHEEFMEVMTRIYRGNRRNMKNNLLKQQKADERVAVWRRTFVFCDSKGNGQLSEEELLQGIKQRAYPLSAPQLKVLLAEHNISDKPFFSFDDFRHIMMKLTDEEGIQERLKHEVSRSLGFSLLPKWAHELAAGNFVLDPEGVFGFRWTFATMILVVYTAFLVPGRLAFDSKPGVITITIDIISELWFLLDIVVNFRMGFYDKETGELVKDLDAIRWNYMRGWFAIDCLSSIPVAIISQLIGGLERFSALRVLRMAKLFRMLRLMNMRALQQLEDSGKINPAIVRFCKVLASFLLVLHLVACGYWSFVRSHCSIDMTEPIVLDLSWCPDPQRVHGYSERQSRLTDKYVAAFYWAVMMMLGDNAYPESNAQFYVSIVMSLLGMIIFSTIIGSLSSMLSTIDSLQNAKKEQMNAINEYLSFRKVDRDLCKRIRGFYNYMWHAGLSYHQQKLFSELPAGLKTELTVILKEELVLTVPLFRGLSSTTLLKIVQSLKAGVVTPGTPLVVSGVEANSMYFLSRGSVGVYVVDERGHENLVSTRSTGFHFGEVAFFGSRVRAATIKAHSYCEIDKLTYANIEAIMEDSDDLKDAIKQSARAVFATIHLIKRDFENEHEAKQQHTSSKGSAFDLLRKRKSKKHRNSLTLKKSLSRNLTFSKSRVDAKMLQHEMEEMFDTHQSDVNLSKQRIREMNKKYDVRRTAAFSDLISIARSGVVRNTHANKTVSNSRRVIPQMHDISSFKNATQMHGIAKKGRVAPFLQG